jgi:predicted nucleotide-binding protein (sugar kinase/HSP70/actin superfamily)
MNGEQASAGQEIKKRPLVALIGHPYLLYDDYVNQRLVYRLEQAGCRVVSSEMVNPVELDSARSRLSGEAYWTYEDEIVGAGAHFLEGEVDGVIGITSFGCGPDSLMIDKVRRYAASRKKVPFMSLTLEEHTAEAGLITRLEAFTDMITRRKKVA